MAQGNSAALGIDGSSEPRHERIVVELDDEASAFIRCLMREHGLIGNAPVAEVVVRAGLHALGL